MKSVKLKIGCFDQRLDGFIHLDINPEAKPDYVADICSMPFEDSSVDEIVCWNVLEHVPDTLKAMRECWRVLKPGGRMKIVVPHALNPNLHSTPDHVKGFTYTTFNQFWQGYHTGYPRFRCVRRRLVMRNAVLQKLADVFPLQMEYFHWIFTPDSVEAELEKYG